jgi:serine/threonine-protein kinase
VAEDNRTKIGPTGPVRVQTGQGAAAAPTPVPTTDPPENAPGKTSYLPDTGDPLIGQTLAGRYQIVRKLGEGGMGAVYLATHELLEKQVALKVLHGEFARKPDLVERFMQEAKAASRIRHENVIDISDFGKTPEGLVFFAMELLKGHDLHDEVARARLNGQLLPWSRSKKIFLQICAALTAAHDKGIIHRDLKPENVYLVEFLGDPDFVKLLDFGIAKLTEVNEEGRKLTKTGMLFGTPEYMSPEQARGEKVDHRVDVYAMGCILFQLVTGRVPFEADNFMGVLSLHLTEPPPAIPDAVFDRIGAPRALAGVIATALAKDRHQRWAKIDDFANAVRQVCGDPITSAAAGASQRAPSVPAPEQTTTRGTPPIGVHQVASLSPPPPRGGGATGTHNRIKTQWTGNLSVPPAEDLAPRPGRSKLVFVLGGLLVVAAGAVAAVLVMRGGTKSGGAGEGSGSATLGAAGGSQAIAAVTPDAAVVEPPPLPAPPEWSTITIESTPKGAKVIDLSTKTDLGTTPRTFKLKGSHTPRQFSLALRGYGEVIVELVPNQDKLKHTETLVKGAGTVTRVPDRGSGAVTRPDTGSGTVTRPDTGSARPPDTGSARPPETGSATRAPETGSARTPDEDCPDPDLPCLKTNVPGLRGSGSGSTP